MSAFADHAEVSRNSLVKIDPALPFEHAALFGCAVLTGVGPVVNSAGIRPGQSVGVIGLGGVGLNSVLGALMAGARQVIAIDQQPGKLELARQLGATAAFDGADPELVAKVKEAGGGGAGPVHRPAVSACCGWARPSARA